MTKGAISETIRQFFGGNFHQDWDLVAEEWEGVVDSFANRKDPARLTALAFEIDDLSEANEEDTLVYLMPRQAHCAYNPQPLTTYHEWLSQIANRLRQHAASNERSGTPKQP